MAQRLRAICGKLLMLDDTPHRIALGMAIGVFISWTPTVGFQMLAAVPLAYLLRANRVAGVIGVYLSNPFTLVPMYWLDYHSRRDAAAYARIVRRIPRNLDAQRLEPAVLGTIGCRYGSTGSHLAGRADFGGT
jgi:hypothetical protein